MREVFVVGVGQAAVGRHGEASLRALGGAVVREAMAELGDARPSALYVGNMLAGSFCHQRQLGALIADAAGLRGIEALSLEAACGSGAAALRTAVMAIASGQHELAVACGVERMTHARREDVSSGLATASDWEREGGRGETFLSLNARLTAAYLERHRLPVDVLAPFSLVAHDNATRNPHALLRKPVSRDDYERARTVEPPLRLYDVSPVCDGAAAVVLGSREALARLGPRAPRVRVLASTLATDALALADRRDPLALDAATASSARALAQAGIARSQLDLFELHDAYSIMAILSLEAAGFAPSGEGHRLGSEARIGPRGDVPIATMGGLKARGHPVGATGVYQLVEAYLQLAGRAGANQIEGAALAMTQNFGGTAATAITHLLERAG